MFRERRLHKVRGREVTIIDADYSPNRGLVILTEEAGKFWIEIPASGKKWRSETERQFVRWLPDASVMLVPSRANEQSPDASDFTWVFTLEGKPVRRIMLGDSIEKVVVTSGKEIWVGYFDEGVYGGGVGRDGLLKFNSDGVPQFRYHTDVGKPVSGPLGPFIDDCYALSPDQEEGVWMCAYSSFELVHIHSGGGLLSRTITPKKLHGSHAIQIWPSGFVAFAVPYGTSPGELFGWTIGSSDVKRLANGKKGVFRALRLDSGFAFLRTNESEIAGLQVEPSGAGGE